MNKKIWIASGIIIVLNVIGFGFLYYKIEKRNALNKNLTESTFNQNKFEEEKNLEQIEDTVEKINKENLDKSEDNFNQITSEFVLSGKTVSNGVSFSWNAENLGEFDGFKLLKSKNENPVYPGSEYVYFSNKEVRSYVWEIVTGEKYHFRICKYDDGKCILYSNDLYLDTPEKKSGEDETDDEYASNISLSATKDGDDVKLKWSISGGGAPMGFKVVIDNEKNPVYPGNKYHYLSSSSARSDVWKDDDSSMKLKDGNTYYFRVCIYKGGKCGAYSNNVSISF